MKRHLLDTPRCAALVLALAGTVLMAASLAAAPVAGPQQGGPWTPTPEEVELAGEARELLNAERTAAGLVPLLAHANLDRLAYQHAREMALRGSVTHHSHLYGVSSNTRFELAFPSVYQFGENVAVNRDPEGLHAALMASAGHRLNRMDASFTHAGFGLARSGAHQVYMTEVFARVVNDSHLDTIEVLYTELAREDLPHDTPAYGEVIGETVRIGAPGPDNPEYWTQAGLSSYDAHRYQEAIEHFRKSIAIDTTYEYAHYNLARAYLGAGLAAEALTVLEGITQRHPDDSDAWSSTGTALLLLQRHDEAIAAFQRVLASKARDAGTWYNLGLAHEMLGHLDLADSAYRQALHVDPDLVAATAALARIQR
jgi:uncharacterized protein YkwD